VTGPRCPGPAIHRPQHSLLCCSPNHSVSDVVLNFSHRSPQKRARTPHQILTQRMPARAGLAATVTPLKHRYSRYAAATYISEISIKHRAINMYMKLKPQEPMKLIHARYSTALLTLSISPSHSQPLTNPTSHQLNMRQTAGKTRSEFK
jgi:hypothetical protein